IKMPDNNDQDQSRRPVHTEGRGGVEAAVWERYLDDGRVGHHVTVSKSYRDAEGWHRCSTFSLKELKALKECVGRAEQWVIARQQELRGRSGQDVVYEVTPRDRKADPPDNGRHGPGEGPGVPASRAIPAPPGKKVTQVHAPVHDAPDPRGLKVHGE